MLSHILEKSLSFSQVSFLTFQAVVQVMIICCAGFWAANSGLLSNEGTKVISRLNVDLFTPALIFSKLASSLSLKKLVEVIIIPILFVITTFVSYCASIVVSKWLALTHSESNFVTAMAVFGNSNSLPVSLTLALAYTLPNLEWDDLPDDTPDKIAGRGLIYLLIFQQLGQVLRWSWGYNKLLKPQPNHIIFHHKNFDEEEESGMNLSDDDRNRISSDNYQESQYSSSASAEDDTSTPLLVHSNAEELSDIPKPEEEDLPILKRIFEKFVSWMNPPLWSMLCAIIVASVPFLKSSFYENDGFIQHTLSSAIKQLGTVSIPLILVVLGANLSPSSDVPPACPHYKRMIIGSLLSRMLIPSLILLPLIVCAVKYIGLSIMDDPIFLITSFLLITSPPAIQLSQICQLNEIYQKEMAGVLFYGYVIFTLPVTIVVVVTCLEAMKWANL
ncbi:hypothetical protein DAMA08_034940 [Martiniozyma asiatica (nom. inval.)]|nr:hypothetical protein DAMA08_034940 [Martiniozyma asiatica]